MITNNGTLTTKSGTIDNTESFVVMTSWNGYNDIVFQEKTYFEKLWNDEMELVRMARSTRRYSMLYTHDVIRICVQPPVITGTTRAKNGFWLNG